MTLTQILKLNQQQRLAYKRYAEQLSFEASITNSSKQEGWEDGVEVGIKKGMEKGRQAKKKEIIAQLYKNQNISIPEIAKLLSVPERKIREYLRLQTQSESSNL